METSATEHEFSVMRDRMVRRMALAVTFAAKASAEVTGKDAAQIMRDAYALADKTMEEE